MGWLGCGLGESSQVVAISFGAQQVLVGGMLIVICGDY
jgi:hypothetical protein